MAKGSKQSKKDTSWDKIFENFGKGSLMPKTLKFGGKLKIIMLGLGILIAVVVGKSCFYIVDPAEEAVVRRFGQVVAVKGAGPHMKLPNPIDKIIITNVAEQKYLTIGYRQTAQGGASNIDYDEAHMLTGDENIVSVGFLVRYQINDVVKYLFNVRNVEQTMKRAAEASIREIAGATEIDDLLTTGKDRVQESTKNRLQEILDMYGAGVDIKGVELKGIEPPSQVMNSFNDVVAAKEDKSRYVNQAEAYQNENIPMARARVETILLEAESYNARTVGAAQGEASRFSQVYESYINSPDVTKRRMYIEAMVNIIESSDVIVVDENIDSMSLFTDIDGVLSSKQKQSN